MAPAYAPLRVEGPVAGPPVPALIEPQYVTHIRWQKTRWEDGGGACHETAHGRVHWEYDAEGLGYVRGEYARVRGGEIVESHGHVGAGGWARFAQRNGNAQNVSNAVVEVHHADRVIPLQYREGARRRGPRMGLWADILL